MREVLSLEILQHIKQIFQDCNLGSNAITTATKSSWVYNFEEEDPPPSYFDAKHVPCLSSSKQIWHI